MGSSSRQVVCEFVCRLRVPPRELSGRKCKRRKKSEAAVLGPMNQSSLHLGTHMYNTESLSQNDDECVDYLFLRTSARFKKMSVREPLQQKFRPLLCKILATNIS